MTKPLTNKTSPEPAHSKSSGNLSDSGFGPLKILLWVLTSIIGLGTSLALILDWLKNPLMRNILGVSAYIIIFSFFSYQYFWNKKLIIFWRYLSIAVLFIATALFFMWGGTWFFSQSNNPDYGIEITSPENGAQVNETVEISGKYRTKPLNGSFILIVKSYDTDEYWPSSDLIQFDEVSQTWKGKVFLSGQKKFVVIPATIGKSGRSLYDYFLKVGQMSQAKGENGIGWPSIEKLTDDIKEYPRITVETR